MKSNSCTSALSLMGMKCSRQSMWIMFMSWKIYTLRLLPEDWLQLQLTLEEGVAENSVLWCQFKKNDSKINQGSWIFQGKSPVQHQKINRNCAWTRTSQILLEDVSQVQQSCQGTETLSRHISQPDAFDTPMSSIAALWMLLSASFRKLGALPEPRGLET